MRNSFRLALPVTIFLLLTNLLFASTELTGSWVYNYLNDLMLRAGNGGLLVNTGPYTRYEIADYLGAIDPSDLDPRSKWFHRMLSEEFGFELSEEYSNSIFTAYSLRTRVESHSPARLSSLFELDANTKSAISAWALFRASINWSCSHKTYARPWKDVARCGLDAGGLVIADKGIEFFIGRDEVSWGADFRRGLLISGEAPSFDMVKFKWRTRRFCYTWFASKLRGRSSDSEGVEARRYLTAHRIEFILNNRLNIGFSESVVYGGEQRGFELAYLNPVAVLYAEQWNLEQDDNILSSVDFSFAIEGMVRIRGEILIDDFQYDSDGEANKLGGLITIRALNPLLPGPSSIGFSYLKIQPNVYTHRKELNEYTHEQRVIGYPDGSDIDGFSVSVDLAYPRGLIWESSFRFAKKGNHGLRGLCGVFTNCNGWQKDEKMIDAGLAVRWQSKSGLLVEAEMNWNRIENRCGLSGESTEDMRLMLSVNLWKRSLLNLK
ncbi:MAG: capsule assembly Wzi family protein [bacterium]